MRKVVCFLAVLVFSVCLFLYQQKEAAAAFWSDSWLVSINGQEYTADEFNNWWSHWNDDKSKPVPDSPDEFIEHQLLIQQAVEMEYDQNPAYLNKLRVFLKFRSLMALRNEEINAKVKVSDEDVKQYFYENYSPVWFLQILTFKDLNTAEDAYKKMEPFNGRPAGRLFVADFQGVDPADGGPLAYEEVEVAPRQIKKAKKDVWLEVIRQLKPAEIARPFVLAEGGGHAVIFRLDSQRRLGDAEVDAKKKTIRRKISKAKGRRKTNQLISSLMAKYHVVVNDELVAKIDFEKEYEADFLKQSVVSMDDLEVTVADLIRNMKQERKVRSAEVGSDFIKQFIMSNILSHTLVDKEALSRHYEERPPLKKTWDFYKGNMLRATLLSEIKDRAKATGEEIIAYYNENQGQYSTSGHVKYSLLKGEQGVIDKIWRELLSDRNKDFGTVAEKYGKAAREKTSAISILSPEMSEIVGKLSAGGISTPFPYGQGAALILLKKKTRGTIRSLAEVRGRITNELNEKKYQAEKASSLEIIRSRSEIKVNEKEWNKLRREL